jgi:DNA-binding PadR family transcriptional regulator
MKCCRIRRYTIQNEHDQIDEEVEMFGNEVNSERGEDCDPRSVGDRRWRGFARGAVGHRCGWGRRGRHCEHGWLRGEGFDPNLPGVDADDASDFNYEDGGDDMAGHERGRPGHHHARGREGWGFGGHQGRGPGQPDRPLEQGDLRWLTLDLIASQPRHGYEIIKAIADALSGHYTPSPGVIYPTLALLEDTGLIVGETQGAKKLYRLTDEGRVEVEAHAAEIRAARGRLEEANARFGGRPAPELIRAMNNLRAALQVRLAKGNLSAQALGIITAALDRAAGEIERS